jgi:hypothetical protein
MTHDEVAGLELLLRTFPSRADPSRGASEFLCVFHLATLLGGQPALRGGAAAAAAAGCSRRPRRTLQTEAAAFRFKASSVDDNIVGFVLALLTVPCLASENVL